MRQSEPYLLQSMVLVAVKTWTQWCEVKHPHQVVPRSCWTVGAGYPRNPSKWLPEVSEHFVHLAAAAAAAALERVPEQLSLCGQHFRKARRRGWWLLRSAAACMPETVRIATGGSHHLECAIQPISDMIYKPKCSRNIIAKHTTVTIVITTFAETLSVTRKFISPVLVD